MHAILIKYILGISGIGISFYSHSYSNIMFLAGIGLILISLMVPDSSLNYE